VEEVTGRNRDRLHVAGALRPRHGGWGLRARAAGRGPGTGRL